VIEMRKILDTLKRVWARVRALEPARLAEAVRFALAAAVTLGWVTIDDARINAIASAVAVVGSVLLTRQVRGAVTPVAKLDGCTVVHEHDPATEG
jgi:hypothetical protein